MNHEIAVGANFIWKRTLFAHGKMPVWMHFTGWASQEFGLITEGAGDYEVLVTTSPPDPDRNYTVGDDDLLAKNFAPYALSSGTAGNLVNSIYCMTGEEVFTEVWVWVKPKTPNVAVGVMFMLVSG